MYMQRTIMAQSAIEGGGGGGERVNHYLACKIDFTRSVSSVHPVFAEQRVFHFHRCPSADTSAPKTMR